jgi:hypothetical protein
MHSIVPHSTGRVPSCAQVAVGMHVPVAAQGCTAQQLPQAPWHLLALCAHSQVEMRICGAFRLAPRALWQRLTVCTQLRVTLCLYTVTRPPTAPRKGLALCAWLRVAFRLCTGLRQRGLGASHRQLTIACTNAEYPRLLPSLAGAPQQYLACHNGAMSVQRKAGSTVARSGRFASVGKGKSQHNTLGATCAAYTADKEAQAHGSRQQRSTSWGYK